MRTLVVLALTAGLHAQTHVEAPWAAPGQVANPVAICFDWQGNLYVAETDRAGNAVQDTRNLGHLNAVEEDLKLHTVEDRLALINTWLEAGEFEPDYFTRTEGRVRRIADTDGDGLADESVIFAGAFNEPLDGIASGVLYHDGKIYFTNIPHLWTLEDTDGDGISDTRDSISYGYGVRWCFYGHDLHGLTLGPDGRIYFSIGDRGFNVTTQEGVNLVGPQTGGVFRCWPDGSGLELFYQGLRNPQELAFDEFGNLFTGDNNCDSGDRARVHHIVEGGDSGWRQDVQSLPSRGPWNREHTWKLVTEYPLDDPARPAWTLPPVAHVGAGPSGIAYYPGVGESDDMHDHILMVDFYGSGATVHAFRMVENGAWFDLENRRDYYKGKTVTDIAYGYDGRLYLSDWGGGWSPNPNGNVFTLTDEAAHEAQADLIAEIGALFKAGFAHRPGEELIELLAHRDQRVRLAAQYEIASRDDAADALTLIARSASAPLLQRVHAVWAVGMIARRDPGAADALLDLATDAEAQIRIQSVKILADLRVEADALYLSALDDANDQVRFYAALGLGKTRSLVATKPLLDLLEANDNRDPVLRHGAVHALTLLNRPDELIDAVADRAPAARLGAVLTLRRLENIGLAAFLHDENAQVAIGAARAIYDLELESGLPAVAQLLDETIAEDRTIEPMMRRIIEANANLGTAEAANRLAHYAAHTDREIDEPWRILALEKLDAWTDPIKREGVWGHWVDLPARDEADAQNAFIDRSAYLTEFAWSEEAAPVLASLRARYESDLSIERKLEIINDPAEDSRLRATLLFNVTTELPESASVASLAILNNDDEPIELKTAAISILSSFDQSNALAHIQRILEDGPVKLKQAAARNLGNISAGEPMLADLVAAYDRRDLDPALALEVLDSADMLLSAHASTGAWPTDDVDSALALLAAGGDPDRGRDVFLHHAAAQCLRCHTIDGQGGTAGPDLTHIRSTLTLPEIVDALIEPQSRIAPGYATVAMSLTTGETITGAIRDSTETSYVVDLDGQQRTIQRAHVKGQVGPTSAMPAMGAILDPYQARDLVAYLATLIDPAQGPAAETVAAAGQSVAPDEPSTGAVHSLLGGLLIVILGLCVALAWVLTRVARATGGVPAD